MKEDTEEAEEAEEEKAAWCLVLFLHASNHTLAPRSIIDGTD